MWSKNWSQFGCNISVKMVKAVEVSCEKKSIMCSSNYQSMVVRHKKLQRIDCTLNVTLEHPGVHCDVFM